MSGAAIHWFRHGQRLHDNPALLAALEECSEFYPLFIWDNFSGGLKDADYNRVRFIHESLRCLDDNLQKHGGRLFVVKGDPKDVLQKLFKEWGITKLTVEHDLEPVWGERDTRVRQLCGEMGVKWEEHVSLTLYDEKDILAETNGKSPSVFEVFKNTLEILGQPNRPKDTPDFTNVKMPIPVDFDEKFNLPSIEQLGYKQPDYVTAHSLYVGGESEALTKLEGRLVFESKHLKATNSATSVTCTQTNPNLCEKPMSLSPYLRMGCLSIRSFYWSLRDNYFKDSDNRWIQYPKSTPQVFNKEAPFQLTEHLVWRDFFYVMSVNVPNYDKMEGNPLCMQICWDRDQDKIRKWEEGQTGFPWIDACMRQLKQEGWIHHVCRHAVTCFLTRGDLWVHWEEGFKVFEKYLLDADWSVCAGNWMWVSSSAFENCLQCPQCYSPYLYGARMDPSGEYVKRYVPEVKNLPLRYLFTPWKASAEIQEKAKCIVGQDYPAPMVDHALAWKQCKKKMEDIKTRHKNINVKELCNPSSQEEVWNFSYVDIIMRKDSFCSYDLLCNMTTMAL